MPRNMSFRETKDQMYARRKFVTSRYGWDFLKPGDVLWAVEQAQGLKKGERVKRICKIRVLQDWWEPSRAAIEHPYYGDWLVRAEGFPDWTPTHFVEFLEQMSGKSRDEPVHRIHFEYVEED